MKIAFIFPGQGSQKAGMGKDLYDTYPKVRELYDRANEALGFDIASLSFNGPEEELKQTKNAQVAILLHSLAADMLLRDASIEPEIVAGHSLGEYSANVSAGSLDLTDALHVVRFRGELMWQSGVKRAGTMSAIVGLEGNVVEDLCKEASAEGVVSVANYNSPVQVVISGEPSAVGAASRLAEDRGAKRVVPLKVSGAFHTELMAEAAESLSKVLSKSSISDPRVPVIANCSAKPVTDSGAVAEALDRQMLSPVLWSDSMRTMQDLGADCFVEVGPGKVLLGLLKRTVKGVSMHSVEDTESLKTTLDELAPEVKG
jgi:[acyl-carrier-protein] S-malonyltransferase